MTFANCRWRSWPRLVQQEIVTLAVLYYKYFEPNVPNIIEYSLTNAAQAFQRRIDKALQGLPRVFVYLDDILIASQDDEQHETDLESS